MENLIINGMTFETDFTDADFIDRYERATKEMAQEAEASKTKTYRTAGEAMKTQCMIVRIYFDKIFGDGTAEKLFGDKYNLRDSLDAVARLSELGIQSRKELDSLINKYSQRQQQVRQKGHKTPYRGGHK